VPWAAASADGWRGIIGEGFTPASVRTLVERIVEAACGPTPLRVLVTHDGRRGGAQAARAACAAATARGARVRLVPHLPTPTATAAIRLGHADLALLITASHNPANWNGVKVKVAPGCPPHRDLEETVTRSLRSPLRPPAPRPAVEPVTEPAGPLVDAHLDEVLSRLPHRPPARLSVVVDGLGGVAGAPLGRLCARLGWRVNLVDAAPDPDFGGLVPDPSRPASRQRAAERVLTESADLGIVLDGDGDRVYVLDHQGRSLEPHELFALLLEHRYRHSWHVPGAAVAVTAATGTAARWVAAQHGVTVHETGIGFKHLSPLLAAGRVDAAAGGVGDLGFAEFGLDRDPYAACVLLADLLAESGRSLAALTDDLRSRAGRLTWFEHRVDRPDGSDLTATGRRVLTGLGLAGDVTGVTTVDGVKFLLSKGQWLLLRASTTEGGIRIYGEAADSGSADALVRAVTAALESSPS
jgi:phosphomannomutase